MDEMHDGHVTVRLRIAVELRSPSGSRHLVQLYAAHAIVDANLSSMFWRRT